MFRDTNDAKYKLFELLETEPTTTVNTSGTGYQTATLVANLEGNVTGNLTGTIQTAAQTNITSLGTLTAVQIDNINIDGNTISSTAGTDLHITPLSGQQIVLDDTIIIDAGVVTGATSITSTAFVGNVTGNVSGSSATVTGAAQTAITSLGTLTALQVDNININGNTISSTAGTDLNINPLTGQQIVLDGTIIIDAGVVTGATSITSTAFVGDLTGDVTGNTSGNAGTATTLANSRNFAISGDITASAVAFDGSGNVTLSASIDDNVVGAAQLNISGNGTAGQAVLSDGDGSFSYGDASKTTEEIQDIVGGMVTGNTETGISVTYEDGDGTLDFVINPAQTTITSLLATDIKIGEDDQTKIDFETADEIHFYAANAHQIKLIDGAIVPVTTNDIDLGTSSLEFKNAFFDGTVTSDAFAGPLTGDVTGNASTATTLQTARTIGGTSFDGSSNISVALADTATALATARTIGGVSFDGTANINLAGVNTAGTQDTSGNAATATALETARTINGVSFDGSANITTLTAGTGVSVSGTAVSIGQAVATSNSPEFANLTLSGTDSIKVPAGTTGQRNGSPVNGMFRYNSTNAEFEGYQNGAWGAIAGGGASAMETNNFTGDGSTRAFTISSNVNNEDDLIIFIEGVYQNKDTFVASGTTVTFDTAPANNRKIVVNHIKANIAGSSVTQNAFSGDGSTVAYTLSISPTNENNTQIYIDGVYQHKSTYTVSGTTLTFDTAPVNGTAIDVIMFSQTSLNTPASDSVTTSTIVDGNVTTAKILDANVTTAKLADSSVTSAKIADGTIATGDIADDAVTSAKLDTNIDIAGTFDVTGATTLDSTLTVSGDATFDTSTLKVDSTNNRVGIGTTSPSYKLEVESSSDADLIQIQSTAGANNTVLRLGISGDVATLNASGGSSGALAIKTYGSERMRIDASGNVGIGDTSPATKLEILDANGVGLRFGDIASTPSSQTAGYIGMSTSAYSGRNGDLVLIPRTSSTSNILLMEGNVGIGTSSPDTILEIASGNSGGDAALDAPVFRINNTTEGSDWDIGDVVGAIEYYSSDESGNAPYVTSFIKSVNETGNGTLPDGALTFGTATYNASGGAVERMRIDSSGNVGIGTTSPSSYNSYGDNFVVASSTHTGISIVAGTTSQSTLMFADGTGGTAGYRGRVGYDHNADTMVLHTAAAERMRIDSSGRVLVGATSSAVHSNVDDLQIGNGTGSRGIGIHSANNANGAIFFSDPDSTLAGQIEYSHDRDDFVFVTGTTTRLRIDSDGLKFGSDTAAANALDDYEEGTWTPACGATLSTAVGHYTKIGNQVTVHYHIVTTGGLPSSTGQVIITGLPFTSNSGSLTAAPIYARYYTPNDSTLTSLVQDSETQIRLINTNDQNFDYTIWGELEASANNSVYIIGSATYMV